MNINDATLRVLIDEAVGRAIAETPVPRIVPATVVDSADPLRVSVLVDGDVDPIIGQSVIGPLFDGARVMVTFNPPAGLLVTGWVPDPLMAWTQPAFKNAWVNFFAGLYQGARYRLEPNGVVRLQGLISTGVVGLPAFTLPAELCPAEALLFAEDTATGHGRLDINTNGDVTPVAGSNIYFSINCTWVV